MALSASVPNSVNNSVENGRTPTTAPGPGSPLFGSQGVPEPSSLLLVGTGLVGVALTSSWRRRRTRLRDGTQP